MSEHHEKRLEIALKAARMSMWTWRPATNQVVWSGQTAAIVGRPVNELGDTYEAFLDLVHPEDREAVNQHITATLHEITDRYEIVHRIIWPDGTIRWVEGRGQVVRTVDERSTCLASTLIDVTKHKEREREVEKSEMYRQALYRITSDTSPSDEEKIQRLLALGCERLGVENGFVSHIDEATGRYEIRTAYGSNHIQAGTELDLAEMYCEKTIVSDDILGIYNAAEEGWTDHPSNKSLHLGCYIGGKILVDDQLYGTLCFVSREPREVPFTHTEKAFVDLMTRWVSHVLERRKHTEYLQLKHRAMEAAPIGITITDPRREDNPLVYVNEAFLHLTGYSAEECLGRNCRFLQDDTAATEQVAKMHEAIAAREPVTVELRNCRKDGTVFWNRVSIAPVRDASGDVAHFVGFQEDVTERKEAERELHERELHLKRYKQYTDGILNAIDDVLYVVDASNTLLRWNEALSVVGGYTHDDIASMQALDFFAENDRNAVRAAIDETLRTGHGRVEAHVITARGKTLPYEFVASALDDPDGNRVLAGIGRDISQRVAYERELERSTALLKRIQHMAQIGGFELDLRTDPPTSRWTEELYRLHDLPPDTDINLEVIIDCYHPDDRQRVRQAIEASLSTGASYDIEARMRTGPGALHWVRAIGDAVYEGGEFVAFRGVIQDITERKRYEEKLHESKEYAEGLIAAMQDGFAVFDTALRQVQVNNALCRMTGFTPAELIGAAPPYPYWPPEEVETILSEFGKLIEGRPVENLELIFMRKDGARFPVIVAPSTLTDDTGRVVNYFSTMKDITQRKQAEEALRERETYFRTLVENTPVIFFAVNDEGIFTVSEGRQLAHLGLEPGEVVGRSIFDVYADVPPIVESIRRILEGEERTWRAEVEGIIFDSYGAPIRDENGEVVGAIGVVTDVTERTRVARENARLVKNLRAMSIRLLEAQEQERRRIARELHDEAGTLLTSLQMCLDTAQRHVPSGRGADVAQEELQEAQELTGTLSNRVRQMALNLRPSVLDDLGLAAALRWLADWHTRHTGLNVQLYHEIGEHQRFSGTVETAAYRIIQEALTNTSRYADVDNVQVMVNVLEDRLRLHIIDEGRGFDLEHVQREHETIGLSSMRERAELLQGSLEIATAPGEGTRISATLPIHPR